MAEGKQFVNVQMGDDLVAILDEMIASDGETDRSKFIRRLIRQEAARRAGILRTVHFEELPDPSGVGQVAVAEIEKTGG
jgi:Arc/MetJ-type ribon-helix-helix transcriptional regulator